jgi:hypothetical protein
MRENFRCKKENNFVLVAACHISNENGGQKVGMRRDNFFVGKTFGVFVSTDSNSHVLTRVVHFSDSKKINLTVSK